MYRQRERQIYFKYLALQLWRLGISKSDMVSQQAGGPGELTVYFRSESEG